MSYLTVDQLKSALVSRSVELPSPNAKKSEYIRLYQKHVSPLKNIRIVENQFSSDDDDEVVLASEKRTHFSRESNFSKTAKTMSDISLSVDGLDITSLGDDELYDKLTSLGATVGPIVDSTRRIYQKKLFALMGGDVVDSPYNGDVDAEEDYSDNEENYSPGKQAEGNQRYTLNTSKTTVTKQPPSPISSTNIRKRIFEQDSSSDRGSLLNSLSFDHDRHTPSPRPSLRTVTSSSSTTTTTKYTSPLGNIRESKFVRHTYSTPTKDSDESRRSYYLRLLVKIIFIIILIASFYFIYEYLYSESPFNGIEHLARQAFDSSQTKSQGDKKASSASPK